MVKAILSKIWLEHNQRDFHNKPIDWTDRFSSAQLLASTWCSQSKSFADYSIQDIGERFYSYKIVMYFLCYVPKVYLFRCISVKGDDKGAKVVSMR